MSRIGNSTISLLVVIFVEEPIFMYIINQNFLKSMFKEYSQGKIITILLEYKISLFIQGHNIDTVMV